MIKTDLPLQAFQQAVALHQGGRLTEAERLYQIVLKFEPGHFDALCNLGLLNAQLGKPDEAAKLFLHAIERKPRAAGAHCNLATALQTLNRHDEAINHYRKALAIQPGYVEAHANLGTALQALGRHEEAIAHYQKALRIRPDIATFHFNFGAALQALNRAQEAIAAYKKAITIKPDYAGAHNNLGLALQSTNRHEEAVAHFQKACALAPNNAEALNNLGTELRILGRLGDATEAYIKALKIAPRKPGIYHNLSLCKRFAVGDAHLVAMERLALEFPSLPPGEQVELHFALGKAYSDLGHHERSFQHLLEGNSLKRQQISYDETATLGLLDRIRSVLDERFIRERQGHGFGSTLPVFIFGIPRSGTTLVEQILASHPRVFGGGELNDFHNATRSLGQDSGGALSYPEAIEKIADEQLRQIGATYTAAVSSLAPEADRITDKLLLNFQHAGLIHLVLPNARFINVRRDPVDTCFSCFSTLFAEGHAYTYDLVELGHYHNAYEVMMEHWRRVLPADVMLDVRYEELVADLEGQARRIVSHCGLDWDEGCLTFHNTRRPVMTASANQVRKPIYRSSVGRWQPYRTLLRPLLETLVY